MQRPLVVGDLRSLPVSLTRAVEQQPVDIAKKQKDSVPTNYQSGKHLPARTKMESAAKDTNVVLQQGGGEQVLLFAAAFFCGHASG